MKNRTLTLSILCVLLNIFSASAQTLQEKYDNLLEKSESYQQFKVIPRTDLNAFWSEVTDSINQKNQRLVELRDMRMDAEARAISSKSKLSEVQAKLDESLELNDTIYFLGIPFSKTGYHIMVWAIISVLAVLAVLAYFMFIRGNSLTSRTKREYETLQAELESHKTKAREQQVKLKRELQTAVNQLNERRN